MLDAISEHDLHWLAGWLEGEGCFAANKVGGGCYPVIDAKSVDRDIIMRVAALLGSNDISVDRRSQRHTGQQDIYTLRVSGRRAELWMRKLLPLMGQRRRAAIERALRKSTLKPYGELHHLGTLGFAKAEEIRALYKSTHQSYEALGRQFGVSKWTIGRIVRRQSWRSQ